MFSILIIIFSFKFINYNKNNNISHTGISPSTTCALCLPNTLAVSPSITCALGLPSTQGGSPSAKWLRPWARPPGMSCPAPKPGSPTPGVRSPNRRASSLTLGSCRLQPHLMLLPNSTVHNKNTHNIQTV